MLNKIDHFVVLMMENRSFDQMLGHLYENKDPLRGQSFNGVVGKSLTNPIPAQFDPRERKVLEYGLTSDMTQPNPDPGEEYFHVNTQLYGQVVPEANAQPPFDLPPYNLPQSRPAEASMDGFVRDYANVLRSQLGCNPSYEQLARIMAGFGPADVPVISGLAQQFGVSDTWFASVPSQTFCNRSFLHAGTSHGFVNNFPPYKWLFHSSPTVFNRLHDAKIGFKIYWDHLDIVSWTFLLNPAIWPFADSHGCGMDQFFQDAAKGDLPAYSFIEPRLLVDHNDQHPPASIPPYYEPLVTSSVRAGEKLIADVYKALVSSPCWEKTMFILIYDEHGGCFDHVPPPAAFPPEKGCPVGEQGFSFDRLGIRVPAVIISPYTEQGTIDHTIFDHTSVIKTLSNRFGLPPLTQRDLHASDLSAFLNRSQPRTDIPTVTPLPYTPTVSDGAKNVPLNGFQKAMLALAAGRNALHKISEKDSFLEKVEGLTRLIQEEGQIAKLETVGDAMAFLKRQYAG